MTVRAAKPRIALVGCGDIALRRYLPTLRLVASDIEIAACCDPDRDRARRAAGLVEAWAGPVRAASGIAEATRHERIGGVFNLTPPAAHAEVTADCLRAGCHVFSEKPLATDVEDARALLELARAAGVHLLCAPAVMATTRFRWLEQLLRSGRLGRMLLASAQLANLGPAAWSGYGGDPLPYYQAGVGPAVDQGIYVLHALTGLLGPVQRVQSLQSTVMPRRRSLSSGAPIDVIGPDVVLLQLDFGTATYAQVLSSFAVSGTRAPLLELHAERGSISIAEQPPLTDHGPVDIYLHEPDHGLDGWLERAPVPGAAAASDSLIAAGALHFVRVLRGLEPPRLQGEAALHVIDVIRTAERAAQCGRVLPVASASSPGLAREAA